MGEDMAERLKTGHRIIFGDSRRMPEVEDHSVHLVVTSPPYWQLKDYGGQEQIGYDQSYEDYINNLNLVWQECYRVIHPGCRLCINIGDQFARSTVYGRYKIIPIRTEIIRFCETMGFDYMGAVIWQKVTTCNTSGGGTVMGSFPFPRNGIVKLDYEFILLFKKLGTPPKVESKAQEQSRLSKEEWNLYFSGHWQFPGTRQKDHLAMFPEELPYRLIRMFSFVGETVLDPFLGSGTTTLVAERLDRSSVGYEVNQDYLPLIRDRLGLAGSCEIVQRKPGGVCLDQERSKLPYLFRDPVVFDSKADPKETSYESKIDGKARPREDYLNVREVVSPELVRLSNGLLVRLIGIRENPGTRAEAVAFLQEKTRGRKVFLRLDKRRYDGHGNLLCYLFLKNRTHLNAHLVKKGLVDVDTANPFKYRAKFLKLNK